MCFHLTNDQECKVELHKIIDMTKKGGSGMYADNLDRFDYWLVRIYKPQKDNWFNATDYRIEKNGEIKLVI